MDGTCQPPPRLRARPPEAGAALTEYLGILVIIAAVVIMIGATDIGDTIREALVRAIQTVGDTSTGT